MKDYLIQCIIDWLNAANESDVRVIYAYARRWLHR